MHRYRLEDSFTLRGHVDRISEFYQGLDLYLSTSVHEGIPLSVLEAMARGIPVVAPRVGGFPEIIDDGENGYLIEGRNPRDYAERIRFLSENSSVRAQMGVAARAKVVKEFSVDQMVQRYRDLYHAVVRTPGRESSSC